MTWWRRQRHRSADPYGEDHSPAVSIEPYCKEATTDPPTCPYFDPDPEADAERWIDAPVMGQAFRKFCRRCKVQKG